MVMTAHIIVPAWGHAPATLNPVALGHLRAMGFEGVPDAHQLLHENKHFGKIAIMVGATSEDEGQEEEGEGAIRAEVGA